MKRDLQINSSQVDVLGKTHDESVTQTVASIQESSLQHQHRHAHLVQLTEQINTMHDSLLGRLMMSKSNREIALTFKNKEREAVEIMLDERNATFKAHLEASHIYARRIIDNVLRLSGITAEAAVGVYYQQVSNAFMKKLVELNREFMETYQTMTVDWEGKDEALQAHLETIQDLLLNQYQNDMRLLVQNFTNIIRERVG